MGILYNNYIKVKNRYCIKYFGVFDEFLFQLIYLRPAIERELIGTKIHFCCEDRLAEKLQRIPRIVYRSDFSKNDYGYVRTLNFDYKKHPILELIEESDLKLNHLPSMPPLKKFNKKALIISKDSNGKVKLEEKLINKLKENLTNCELQVEIDVENIDDFGTIIGVESANLYLGAMKGINTTLISENFGDKLFKLMFSKFKILNKDNI